MLSGDTSIGFNVYETLTIWDPINEVVAPVLATSWESNEDGTEWIFHLREGVTFHDGAPLTAARCQGFARPQYRHRPGRL